MLTKIKKFLTPENVFLASILLTAFLIRIFRIDQTLAFHYDQGRDALVIWDLIYYPHKFFLIGPTTGLAGVFRGPFYYYSIAPFYFLGQGSPLWPAVFLAITSVLALFLLFILAREVGGTTAGVIALILGTFSFEIIYASRWLSNPTPMLLLSMIIIWSVFRIIDGRKHFWILLSAALGLSFFNFGSSGELFYFPVIVGIFIWSLVRHGFGKNKSTLDLKVIGFSIAAFFFTFAPLLIFNMRHGNLLSNNFGSLVNDGNSFAIPTWRFVEDRGHLLSGYFSALIFHSPYEKEKIFYILMLIGVVYFLPKVIVNKKTKVVLYFILSVFVGLIFYQGNFGNLYSYYLTGYFLIFLLLISIVFAQVFKSGILGKVLVGYFLLFFVLQNWSWVKPYLNATGDKPNEILFANQRQSIEWIYKEAGSRDFNVDVYVPPVISYSYDYLFKWEGTKFYKKLPSESGVPVLYTIYEADPDHSERLNAWLLRQDGIGKVVKSVEYGGITVQERERIKK